jgi:uncharacterized membrane protein
MSQVIVLVFPSRGVMVDAVDRLKSLDYIDVKNTALIAKAEDGEVIISEDDLSAAEGRVTGGTLGSLIAALGVAQLGAFLLPGVGPIIAIGAGALLGALVGGAAGGVAAGLIDFGFDNDQLESLAEHLQNGKTAVVAEVEEHGDVLPRLQDDLKPYDVEVMTPPQV